MGLIGGITSVWSIMDREFGHRVSPSSVSEARRGTQEAVAAIESMRQPIDMVPGSTGQELTYSVAKEGLRLVSTPEKVGSLLDVKA